MKKIFISLALLGFLFPSLKAQTLRQVNQVIRVKTENDCSLRKGYWYNDKCWLHFKEENYNKKAIDIDSLEVIQTDQIANAHITIDGKEYPIDVFYPEKDNLYFKFSLVYTDSSSQKTLQQRIRKTIINVRKQFVAEMNLFEGNIHDLPDSITPKPIAMGRIQANFNNFDDKDFKYTGVLRDLKQRAKTYKLNLSTNRALWDAGKSNVEFRGNEAILDGEIGMNTYRQIKDIVTNHPEIRTLVLKHITGSVNDDITVKIGELIKGYGLNTKLLADSEISIDGTKLFMAGRNRIVTKGAKIGVKSWDNGNFKGKDLSKEHPIHQFKQRYYNEYLDDKGKDFYFFTLETDASNHTKWLDEAQLVEWDIATEIIDDTPLIINYPGIPEDIAKLGFSFGNNQSNTVIINAQENPEVYLYTNSFKKLFTKYGNIDPTNTFVINVHQTQTLHPERIQKKEISFEEAKELNNETTEILTKVVTYFKSQGKKVILTGMGYGAFTVQDMIAKHGNLADGILFLTGRLNLDTEAWKALSEGKTVIFNSNNSIEIKENTNILEKNKSKLIAAYGNNRFTELLKDIDLTGNLFVYGKEDELFGQLSQEERDFLMKKDVLVLSVANKHKETLEGFLKKGLLMVNN